MKEDNNLYLEDALLTGKVIHTISRMHELNVKSIYRHVRIQNMEIDALAICTTATDLNERWVGFELKENDIAKAHFQATERRPFFDYFYIVINLPVYMIVDYILKNDMHKSGMVSSWENVVVLRSRYSPRHTEKVEKGRKIDTKIVTLMDFLDKNRGWEPNKWKI